MPDREREGGWGARTGPPLEHGVRVPWATSLAIGGALLVGLLLFAGWWLVSTRAAGDAWTVGLRVACTVWITIGAPLVLLVNLVATRRSERASRAGDAEPGERRSERDEAGGSAPA